MRTKVNLGVDVFLEQHVQLVKGLRVGLLTNQTGANAELVSTIRLFHQHPDIQLTALFAPEHGLKTYVKEGEKFSSTVHKETNLPVFSLYGASKKPTEEMMDEVDVVIFDIQDIGARYYTYIYSLAYMMEACRSKNRKMIVLDRPNPIGGIEVEGNLVADDFTSFVGLYPIPNRHGMTVGELASYFNKEFSIHCDLTVVSMEGWSRNMYFSDTGLPWISPSPNTTGIDMMLLYPGTCLIEGTNLSEGRGTTQPFEIIGAPFINGEKLQDELNALKLPNIHFRATSFKPTYQKYQDEICEGIQLHILNRLNFKPVSTFSMVFKMIVSIYGDRIEFLKYESLKHPMFDLLAGNALLRKSVLEGNVENFLEECRTDTKEFITKRSKYLLYR